MIATVKSASFLGVEGHGVDVEVRVDEGAARAFLVYGVRDSAAKEIGVRVRAALAHVGMPVAGRVEVRVSPEVRDAPSLDLPIAVGVLAARGQVKVPENTGFVGELALDGAIRRIPGVLPIALWANKSLGDLVVPADCLAEAAGGMFCRGARTLGGVVEHLRGSFALPVAMPSSPPDAVPGIDLADVRGLEVARRALEVAAAGGHNLLLVGPPGAGKTILARCLTGILPPPGAEEALETACVYSVAGKLDGASCLAGRPFRAPHHDVSVAGLVGGGPCSRPGEASLAHGGVLFLDEVPEFKRSTLEALRQPLLDGRVTIARSYTLLRYPARFLLVGATNPCPCGYRGSALRSCSCSEDRVRRYLSRIPDWFGLRVKVQHVEYREIRDGRSEVSSAVRARVATARAFKGEREGEVSSALAECRPATRAHLELDAASEAHLEACAKRFGFSYRVVERVLRVARTVADLAGRERISASDVAEAVSYQERG